MATRVVEFKSKKDYDTWLKRYGERVRIVSVNQERRGCLLIHSSLGGRRTFWQVTYEEV